MRPCLRPLVLFAIVAAAAACGSGTTPPSSRPLGVITLNDSSDGAGGYLTSPQAVFWDASNITLPASNAPANSCIDTTYVKPDTSHQVIPNQLNAGNTIHFSSTLSTGDLTPDTIPNVQIVYRYHGTGFHFTPGANVTFTVPGASGGFDAGTIAAITAKKLILGPVPSQPTDSFPLTWTAGTAGTDAVNIYLIYETPTSIVPDRQIICSSDDVGSIMVPKSMAIHWDTAANYYQSVHAFRWVTTFSTTTNNGLLYSYSRFDTTAVPVP
jgi:hypothetical protein